MRHSSERVKGKITEILIQNLYYWVIKALTEVAIIDSIYIDQIVT